MDSQHHCTILTLSSCWLTGKGNLTMWSHKLKWTCMLSTIAHNPYLFMNGLTCSGATWQNREILSLASSINGVTLRQIIWKWKTTLCYGSKETRSQNTAPQKMNNYLVLVLPKKTLPKTQHNRKGVMLLCYQHPTQWVSSVPSSCHLNHTTA